MPDPMDRWKQFNLDDTYEVLRTVVVVGGGHTYRIEILKWYSNPGFTARAWVERDVVLRSKEGPEEDPVVERVLVEYDLPLTAGQDADVVLTQALRYVTEDFHDE